MSVQTIRPSTLPMPKSLSSSTPSVASKGVGRANDRQLRRGVTTPPCKSVQTTFRRHLTEGSSETGLKKPLLPETKNLDVARRRAAARSVAVSKTSDLGAKMVDSSAPKRKSSVSSTDGNGSPKSGRQSNSIPTRKGIQDNGRKVSSSSSGYAKTTGRLPSSGISNAKPSSAPASSQKGPQPVKILSTKAKDPSSTMKHPSDQSKKAASPTPPVGGKLVPKQRRPGKVSEKATAARKLACPDGGDCKGVQDVNRPIDQSPDVICVGRQRNFSLLENRITTLETELQRNQAQLGRKQADFESLVSQARCSALGFAAMATLVNHLSDRSRGKEINQKIEKLYLTMEEKDSEVAKWKQYYDELRVQMDVKSMSCITEQELAETVQSLEDRQKAVLEEVRGDHQLELERVHQEHAVEMQQLQEHREAEVRNLVSNHSERLEELEKNLRLEMSQSLALEAEQFEATIVDWRKKEEHWEETKKSLEYSVQSLRSDLKDREEALASKVKGDSLLKATRAKFEAVSAEVESLKAVMEIKSGENRKLRQENVCLDEKLHDHGKTVNKLKRASSMAEDFKAQLDSKLDLERKLSEENRKLFDSVEREATAKEKLIRENEELQWRIRRSIDFGMDGDRLLSMSMVEGQEDVVDSEQTMFRSLHFNPSENISDKLQAADVGADTSSTDLQSLPPYAVGRGCTKIRQGSAPPAKPDLGRGGLRLIQPTPFQEGPLPCQAAPDSPRVLEVVQKTESLSWKLEYDTTEDCSVGKPSPRYHSSLHLASGGSRGSPLSLITRRAMSESPDIMSKSLDPQMASLLINGEDLPKRGELPLRKPPLKKAPAFDALSESVVEEPDSLEDTRVEGRPSSSSEFAESSGRCLLHSDFEDDDFDIGDVSSSSEMEEVTTPQIEALEGKVDPLAFNSSSSGLGSEINASSPDTDTDLTLKESLSPASSVTKVMSSSVCRYPSNSVAKQKPRPVYHHSNSSAMASSLQGIFMFDSSPSKPKGNGGESMMEDNL